MKELIARLCITVWIVAVVLSPMAIAAEGGPDTGGGGNTSGRNMTSEDQIIRSIYLAPLVLSRLWKELVENEYFYERERNNPNVAPNFPLFKKFLDGNEPFLQTIKRSELLPQPEPCIHDGKEDEASNDKKSEICFSVKKIWAREYSPSDIFKKVVALYAHEIAEIRGLTHDEADVIQNHVEQYLSHPDLYEIIQLMEADSDLTHEVKDVEDGFKTIDHALENEQLPSICASAGLVLSTLQAVSSSMRTISREVTGSDQWYLDRYLENKAASASYRMGVVVTQGCGLELQGDLGNRMLIVRKILNDRQDFALYDLYASYIAEYSENEEEEINDLIYECYRGGETCYWEKTIRFQSVPKDDVKAIARQVQLAQDAFGVIKDEINATAKQASRIRKETEKAINKYYGFKMY